MSVPTPVAYIPTATKEEEEDGDSDGKEAITQTPFVCVQDKQSLLLLLADTFTCQFCHLLFIIFPSLLLSLSPLLAATSSLLSLNIRALQNRKSERTFFPVIDLMNARS